MADIGGYANAVYEIFTDNTYKAYTSINQVNTAENANVFGYFNKIFNTTERKKPLNMTIHNGGSKGWIFNDSKGNACDYIKEEAKKTTAAERLKVEYVILNFGFYDIKNGFKSSSKGETVSGSDCESLGRTTVNVASNYYPNAIIIVNPVSTNYCRYYNSTYQDKIYIITYGMTRSQVPIRIVPWYIAMNVNKMATNHYVNPEAVLNIENPEKSQRIYMNSGGTNSVGAMIKNTLLGCENAYERITRGKLNSALNTSIFKASDADFIFDVETMTCKLTNGYIVAQKALSQDSTSGLTIGSLPSWSKFGVKDDTILALCVQNTKTNPIKGYLVLKANNNIEFRFNSPSTVSISDGAILRLLPTSSFLPAFKKIS